MGDNLFPTRFYRTVATVLCLPDDGLVGIQVRQHLHYLVVYGQPFCGNQQLFDDVLHCGFLCTRTHQEEIPSIIRQIQLPILSRDGRRHASARVYIHLRCVWWKWKGGELSNMGW